MITIRKFDKKDLERVAELQNEFILTHTKFDSILYEPKENFSSIWKDYAIKCIDNKTKYFIVAEKEGIIVGYAIVTISERAPVYKISKIGILDAITVDSNYRKLGIGTKLLESCLEWFKENKLNYVEAFIDSKNIESIKLNEKLGFEEYQKRILLKIK